MSGHGPWLCLCNSCWIILLSDVILNFAGFCFIIVMQKCSQVHNVNIILSCEINVNSVLAVHDGLEHSSSANACKLLYIHNIYIKIQFRKYSASLKWYQQYLHKKTELEWWKNGGRIIKWLNLPFLNSCIVIILHIHAHVKHLYNILKCSFICMVMES